MLYALLSCSFVTLLLRYCFFEQNRWRWRCLIGTHGYQQRDKQTDWKTERSRQTDRQTSRHLTSSDVASLLSGSSTSIHSCDAESTSDDDDDDDDDDEDDEVMLTPSLQ